MNEADESTKKTHFRKLILYVVLGNVIGELTVHFSVAKQISDTFNFLLNYQKMHKEELKRKAPKLAENYSKNINSKKDLVQKMNHITIVYNSNFGGKQLGALELLMFFAECRLESIFPNLSFSLRMFLTTPAIRASVKRSFSKLKLNKNYLRFTMGQNRLTNLARLNIESDIAKQINFDSVMMKLTRSGTIATNLD